MAVCDFLPVFVASLLSCQISLEESTSRLENFVGSNKVGYGQDVWMIKQNAFGQYEKVGLVFGYVDDMEFCSEVATMYNSRYPRARMTCMFANH